MDTSKHFRNLNVLVYGGTGSGKSKHPSSEQPGSVPFAATDPKRELLATAPAPRSGLQHADPRPDRPKVRLFNPFRYFKADAPETSILELAENMVTNTTGRSPPARESSLTAPRRRC